MDKKTKETVRNEALLAIEGHKNCGVAVSMGMGKSMIGLCSIKPDDTVLVCYPDLPIKKSWLDDAEKFGIQHLLKQIKFVTHRSLLKEPPGKYTYTVVDEVHRLDLQHRLYLNHFLKIPGNRLLGLTGTKPTFDSKRTQMFYQYFPVVYEYELDEAVDDEILNDYIINVHYLQLDENRTIRKVKKDGGIFYRSEVEEYTYWTDRINILKLRKEQYETNIGTLKELKQQSSEEAATMVKQLEKANMNLLMLISNEDPKMLRINRMRAIQNFPSKEKAAKNLFNQISTKCLLFANNKAQASRMCSHTHISGNKFSKHNLEMFAAGTINKMSCIHQLAYGVNIPDLENIIIMHSFGNDISAAQKIGRILRLMVGKVGIVHVFVYKDSVDEEWAANALSRFKPENIIHIF